MVTDLRASDLRVGGLSRLSMYDWPGELVATVFCQGCPWNCVYCHNPHLIPPPAKTDLAWNDVLTFLEGRSGLLDGVVFFGGEPTLLKALPEAMRAVRDMAFSIGLHNGGPYPARLDEILPLTDWVVYDVKAAFADYERITGVPGSGEKARAGLECVLESGVACDIRTTVYEPLFNEAALQRLSSDLAAMGVRNHRLQLFRSTGVRPAA
ncbi:anaerobic ribonucleoside-triphosphate reductase activating protein [Breoghania sp.]|uniref:anaerobic ribonucleoside-triphosphate reductase activating protein n=1 Tax=Breoghania sp. TaxID=2065378 RepID=UPI00261D2E8F|nr:anaerobic ribonucleoside-triphosphate reductase activating protein [Breoghania sp.]MDJ0933570.1 anaerobic ribonucleoside-triphosphate reductase activating protein [Breoghania sp.]